MYAASHTGGDVTASFEQCEPRLPDPHIGNYGGAYATYYVNSIFKQVRNSDGQVLTRHASAIGFATCGCADRLNPNGAATGNDGSCYCRDNKLWDVAAQACVTRPPDPLIILLVGPSHTKALPAGPALVQSATVKRGDAPAANINVNIRIGSAPEITGTTDAAGGFRFTYVPPTRLPATDQITATCSGCSNTAQKSITVEACDVCEKPFGNPIQPGSGEKEQTEADWQDAGAHPLSLTRHYRSLSRAGSVLGPNWGHNFLGLAHIGTELSATVGLGDGSKIAFSRQNANAPWVADNWRDGLIWNTTGILYIRASDESRWQFDAVGKLLFITQRNGWTMSLAYDASSRLASVTNAFGRSLQFAYDAAGRLTAVTTPEGSSIGYGFDSVGRLTGVGYPGGHGRQYHYEDARWPAALTGITDEAGRRFASFSYDAAGRAVGTQHAGGAQGYAVDYGDAVPATSGRLLTGATVDGSIYRTSVQVTDALGAPRTYTYQGGNGTVRLLGASGAFEGGQVAGRSFVGPTLPESETDFLGVQTLFTWDIGRQLKLATTEAAGRPEARSTQTQWHPDFRLPVLVTEAGRSTAYSYDSLGNKLSETITDTATLQVRTRQWTYNAQGLAETMTDPKGGVWRYAYDSVGNRTSVKNPLGQQTSYTFDAAGRVLAQTEPHGLVTSYAYDARGRLLTQARGGEVSSYSYTPAGQLASASLPNGLQVLYSYDAAQRLVAAGDNRGNSIQYTLDAMGNRIREEVKDANGNLALATGRAINTLNQVTALQGAVGQTTQLAYDANGELVSQTDPLQQSTRQTLDGLRRTTATIFPDNASATQAWNQLDQLTKVTDPKGVATGYQTNAFGEVLSETSPDIGTIKYTRNTAGEVTQIEDAKGQITQIERDALGRPMSIHYADGKQTAFSYDTAGFASEIQDESGVTSFSRDTQGRILAKTQTLNDNPGGASSRHKLGYSYTNGELTSVTYPSGLTVAYQRAAGRITGIEAQPAGKPAATFVSNLTHTALGQPKSWAWSSGDIASRSFDADGRMTANEFASYGYDAAGRITGITQSLWAQKVVNGIAQTYQHPLAWTASYDSRNRLTGFVRSGAESRYTYDPNSNRLTGLEVASGDIDLEELFTDPTRSQSAAQASRIEDASNRLLGFTQTLITLQNGQPVTTSNATINYNVDANGAMTSDGLRDFDHDASGRLAKVRITKSGEAASITYLHNALGQRVFKGEPRPEQMLPNEEELGNSFINWLKRGFGWMFAKGNQVAYGDIFVYGDGELPAWALMGEYDNGSATARDTTEYIWLPTEDGSAIPIGMYRAGKLFAIHSDHLGTPRLITNTDNKPVWQWPYSAFGNNKPTGVLNATTQTSGQITLKGTKPPVATNLRFPGQYADEESNLNYNYFRTYDPRTGRYTQFDPIGLAGGLNGFTYVGGNPLTNIDPDGRMAQSIPIIVPIVIVGCYLSPGCRDFAKNWMESRSRAKGDPRLEDYNPGRDCDGNCIPCRKGVRFFVPKPGHGHENGYWHEIKYNQRLSDCMCFADRPSSGLEGE